MNINKICQFITPKSTQHNDFCTFRNLSFVLTPSLFFPVFSRFLYLWLFPCFLRVHSFFGRVQPHITSSSSSPHLFLAFYWLAMSNSMVNPIIYYWMNRRFRHYFQQILCFCCLRLWKVEDTYQQQNSLSIERKPRLCKYRSEKFPANLFCV